MLDVLVKIRHAKFEPCKTSNLDTAKLSVAINAHCGQISHHKSFYKKGWSENWKRNYYKHEEQPILNSFVKKASQ